MGRVVQQVAEGALPVADHGDGAGHCQRSARQHASEGGEDEAPVASHRGQ